MIKKNKVLKKKIHRLIFFFLFWLILKSCILIWRDYKDIFVLFGGKKVLGENAIESCKTYTTIQNFNVVQEKITFMYLTIFFLLQGKWFSWNGQSFLRFRSCCVVKCVFASNFLKNFWNLKIFIACPCRLKRQKNDKEQ